MSSRLSVLTVVAESVLGFSTVPKDQQRPKKFSDVQNCNGEVDRRERDQFPFRLPADIRFTSSKFVRINPSEWIEFKKAIIR